MNVQQQVDQEHRLVIFTITGELTDAGLLGLADTIEGNPAIGKSFGWLIDLRLSNGIRITTDGVREMASRRLALDPSARRAVVVPRGLGYGMARMYQLLRREGAPQVFTDYEAAYRWVLTGS
jgi:hypothetical protein